MTRLYRFILLLVALGMIIPISLPAVCGDPGTQNCWVVADSSTPSFTHYATPDYMDSGWGYFVTFGAGTDGGAGDDFCRAYCTANCTVEDYTLSGGSGADASYTCTHSETWRGPCPAPVRGLSFTVTGGGSEQVTVTCSAGQGCSVSATSSGSGSATSLGNANATLNMHSISLSANYNSAEDKTVISGNAGAEVTETSATVSGSYSSSGSWSTSGSGAKSGSASYSVVANRSYNGNTSSNYTRTQHGNSGVSGSGTLQSEGGHQSYYYASNSNVDVKF